MQPILMEMCADCARKRGKGKPRCLSKYLPGMVRTGCPLIVCARPIAGVGAATSILFHC